MLGSALFLTASFFAAVAATLAGFGSSTLLIPVAVLFMDLKTAVFLVACFHLFNNTFKIRAFRDRIDLRIFLLFGIPSVFCAFLGAALISVIPATYIQKALAVFLIVFSGFSFIRPGLAVKKTTASAVAGGGLSGFLAGLIGLGGAIRSTFLIAFNLPKEIYVATSAMIAFVIDLTRIPTYIFTGVVRDNSYYVLLPFLLFTAYFGVKAGKALLGRISQEAFRKIVSAALFLVGIKLFFT